ALEGRIVGDLDDNVAVDARLAVVVPHEDGVERVRRAEVDLHPLRRRAELDEEPVAATLLPIRNHVQLDDARRTVARRDLLLEREQDRTFRDVERSARLARDLLEVRTFE